MLVKQLKTDELITYIYSDRNSMGMAAAQAIAQRVRDLLEQKEQINMIFASAPSQNEMLACLVHEEVPWQKVNAFHMDEYRGLSQMAPQTFGNFLKNAIFDHVNFKSVHYIRGNEDPESECERYSALLQQYPADIAILGIGENGHIAFNDPAVADFHDPLLVKEVKLDEMCRNQQVHDGCFASLQEVPESALTLTVPALMRAQTIFCVVPTALKCNAVTLTVKGGISEVCPASIVRTHPDSHLYIDVDSGAELLK